jgi:hypothetical protein
MDLAIRGRTGVEYLAKTEKGNSGQNGNPESKGTASPRTLP